MKNSVRAIVTIFVALQLSCVNAESKPMRSEKFISRGESEEFENGLEVYLGEVNGIDYVRAPGGKVTGLKVPSVLTIPLTLRGKRGRLRTELKVTLNTPNPSVQWNTHLVTFVSIEHESAGYKIKLRADAAKLLGINFGGAINRLSSGQTIGDTEELSIHHAGYVNSHRTSGDGQFSSDSSCMIEVSDKTDKKTINLDVPLQAPSVVEWKRWIFTFKKTDPKGGMSQEAPVEFEVKEK
jgi:hypothetical protein